MEILDKITELKKTIQETEELVEELILGMEAQRLKTNNKERKIILLKEEVKNNIEKIDEIIENYNANS